MFRSTQEYMVTCLWDKYLNQLNDLAERKKNRKMVEMLNKIRLLKPEIKAYVINKYI